MSGQAQLHPRSRNRWFGQPEGDAIRLPESGSTLKGAGTVVAAPGIVA
jgi:hypothetical protein